MEGHIRRDLTIIKEVKFSVLASDNMMNNFYNKEEYKDSIGRYLADELVKWYIDNYGANTSDNIIKLSNVEIVKDSETQKTKFNRSITVYKSSPVSNY